MSSMVMNWLTENFCAVLADVIGGFLDVFGDVVNNIFYWIIQVATENVYVINAERFTVSLATTLISVCVVKNIIAGYFLETDYDAEEDPFNLLVRSAQTEAFILNGNWIFNFLLNFSKHFSNACFLRYSLIEILTTSSSNLGVLSKVILPRFISSMVNSCCILPKKDM